MLAAYNAKSADCPYQEKLFSANQNSQYLRRTLPYYICFQFFLTCLLPLLKKKIIHGVRTFAPFGVF